MVAKIGQFSATSGSTTFSLPAGFVRNKVYFYAVLVGSGTFGFFLTDGACVPIVVKGGGRGGGGWRGRDGPRVLTRARAFVSTPKFDVACSGVTTLSTTAEMTAPPATLAPTQKEGIVITSWPSSLQCGFGGSLNVVKWTLSGELRVAS